MIIGANFEKVEINGIILEVEYAKEFDKDYKGYVVTDIESVMVIGKNVNLFLLMIERDIPYILIEKCQQIEDWRGEFK